MPAARTVALFVPCYVDQLYPEAAIAALRVLERLGCDVAVPDGAPCCGQPPANAGYEREGEGALRALVRAYHDYERVVVLSGSCAAHIREHAAALGDAGGSVAAATVEFCAYLHDDIGLEAIASLGATFPARVAVHVGCHSLRRLHLARASELQVPPFDKVRALLSGVRGLSFAEPARPDECCGFGGAFAVTEPAISARMGRDRLGEYLAAGAEAVLSTDMSCMMHLDGIARREGVRLPVMHVAQVLAGAAVASGSGPSQATSP